MHPPTEPRVEVVYAPDIEAEVSALLFLIGWRQLADDGGAEVTTPPPACTPPMDREPDPRA